jgi:hypothetical protein
MAACMLGSSLDSLVLQQHLNECVVNASRRLAHLFGLHPPRRELSRDVKFHDSSRDGRRDSGTVARAPVGADSSTP